MQKAKLYSLIMVLVATLSGCNNKKTSDDEVKVSKTALSVNYHDVKNNYVNLNKALPSLGEPKLLVFPVYFTDSSNYVVNKDDVRSDIEKAFFGSAENTGFESVSSYYKSLSQDRCLLSGKVADWYDLNKSSTEFKSDGSERSIIDEVTNAYFTNNPTDSRTNYDLDKDGYLDSVILIYGAPNYEALGEQTYNNLWSFVDWIDTAIANKDNPVPSTYMWTSYCTMYDSEDALLRAGTNYGSGNTKNCNIDAHIFIHETGHLFGLKDYYDYSGKYSPAGGFSMQDCNVGSHDPFSAMALGWVDPYIPTDDCEIEIGDFQSTHEVILLTNKFNEYNSPFDEYILLELYSANGLNKFDASNQYKDGYPQGPSSVGVRIWHVDARLLYTSNRVPNANKITTNPNIEGNQVIEMMSNSYSGSYASVLGYNYYNYNMLQLIRRDSSATYTPSREACIKNSDLFYDDSFFSLSTFKKQFINGDKMNNGEYLNWNAELLINDGKAKISLERV